MKVLIITYYWPPSGGSGVQRWLKFVKYLQEFGIEPVVYTVEQPNYLIEDVSLLDEIPTNIKILRQPIWEPNKILSLFKKNKNSESTGFLNPNPSVFGKLLQYIRANYFIPDARKFWIRPSVKFLKKYVSENTIDMIITSGPPHSMHLIGLELKKQLGVKWISDFRDPWTEIDYFNQLPLTKKSVEKHQKLEQEVLKNADAVLVIGETMKEKFQKLSNNIYIITNGFDGSDLKTEEIQLDKNFTITHVGLMNADRNPKVFWKVISEICNTNESFLNDLEIKLIGKVAVEVDTSIKQYKLKKVKKITYRLHEEVQKYQLQSQVLLLAVNNVPSAKGILTGKVFEYLQAKRPILAIGPTDGDLAAVLKETNSGIIINFNDAIKLKETILNLYQEYKKANLVVASKNIEKYHRKALTEKLSKIIKDTILN